MNDIVERLKNPRTEQGDLWPLPNLHEEAADEITRLRAENEKLRNEVMSAFFKGYDQGVRAERERCAKIVLEKVALPVWIDEMEDERFAGAAYDFADAAAAAIRESGDE